DFEGADSPGDGLGPARLQVPHLERVTGFRLDTRRAAGEGPFHLAGQDQDLALDADDLVVVGSGHWELNAPVGDPFQLDDRRRHGAVRGLFLSSWVFSPVLLV